MPTARGMLRMDKLGVVDRLIRASQRGCIVKIICPLKEENSEIVKKIAEQAPDIRIMNGCSEAASGVLIADNEKFFQAEVKDPMADQFSKAIGFAIYSNSKRNVNSFKSFFELLWNERLLNEELEKTDRMEKEFIHVAAHELRTPIQPILGLSEILKSKQGDIKQYNKMIDLINANTRRLYHLTEDILDVTRIDSHSLKLNRERFDLRENIYSIVRDFANQTKDNSDLNISFQAENPLFVEADRTRIYQVISNLISNSVKLTQKGNIIITADIIKNNNDGNNGMVVIVKVSDTGSGIEPRIAPIRNQAKVKIKRYIDERVPDEYEKCLVGLTSLEKHGTQLLIQQMKGKKFKRCH
jgi:two-component system sensor histidine kinase VicK